MESNGFRLTPALQALLQVAACAGTTNTKELASLTGYTRCTVNGMWQRIRERLGLSSRNEALILAATSGLVTLPELPWKRDAEGYLVLDGRRDCITFNTCAFERDSVDCPLTGRPSGGSTSTAGAHRTVRRGR